LAALSPGSADGRSAAIRSWPRSAATDRTQNYRPLKGIPIFKVLSRTWIPLIILAVVLVGGFIVYRVHGYFGSEKHESYADSNLQNPKPFNPKRIVYEVFGPPGTLADISYFDVNADPQRVDGAPLPWTLRITTDKAAMMGNLTARGDSDSIGCRIMVDDVVKAERISNEVHAFTFCVVKSA
jgi:Mycobacterium membrane protein